MWSRISMGAFPHRWTRLGNGNAVTHLMSRIVAPWSFHPPSHAIHGLSSICKPRGHALLQVPRRSIYGTQQKQDYKYFRGGEPFYRTGRFWLYAGTLSCFGGGYYYTHLEEAPVTGRRRFMDVSVAQEQQMGELAYQEIMATYRGRLLNPSHPVVRRIRAVGERIIAQTNLGHLPWEFYVIDAPEMNAFVLPGGKVFVFTGILPILKNDDGIAAVLGHEIAHQVARHSAEKMSFSKILMFLQIAISSFVDISGAMQHFVLKLVLDLPFSRRCESEADYIGLLLMSDACFNPNEASRVWERMEHNKSAKMLEYLSTHPSHHTRIQSIEGWMDEARRHRDKAHCPASLFW